MLAVGRICSAAAGSCFGTSIVSDAAAHTNLMHSCLLLPQRAEDGGAPPAPAVPDESPEEQRDFASLLQQVSGFIHKHNPLHAFQFSFGHSFSTARSFALSHQNPKNPRPNSPFSPREFLVPASVALVSRLSSCIQLNDTQLPQHRRRFARSSAWPVGDGEAAGGFSTLCFGRIEEVHLRKC
jgi:hypothetical protein